MQLVRSAPLLVSLTHTAHVACSFKSSTKSMQFQVVDKKILFRIGSTLVGLLATGLRQDLNEECTHNTTETTQGQLQLIYEQMSAQQQQNVALQQQNALQQQLTEQSLWFDQRLTELAFLVNHTLWSLCAKRCTEIPRARFLSSTSPGGSRSGV